MGRGTSERRKKTGNAVSIVILILGALLLLYPVASTLSYQYRTVKQNEAYATDIAALDSGAKAEQLKNAREYNDRLLAAGPHARAPIEGDPGFDDYMGQLTLPEQYHIMARIPSLRSKVEEGSVGVVAARYRLADGRVTSVQEHFAG